MYDISPKCDEISEVFTTSFITEVCSNNGCNLWDVLKKKNKTVMTLKTVTAFIVKHERRRHKLSEGMKCRIEASR